MQIALIRGIAVEQNDAGVISWTSGAAVDADGANGQAGGPFAYRWPSDDGLDTLRNAGWPMYGWRNVLYDDGTSHPLTDGCGNAYSRTSLVLPGSVRDRAVDSYSVPYVVVNPHVRLNSRGVVLGCLATVSFNGVTINAVVADVSGPQDIGEISIAAARALSIDPDPRTGGTKSGVFYLIYAGAAAVLGDITYPLQPA